jgi:hypothetical protein
MHAETFTYWLPMNTDIYDTDTTGFTRVLMKTSVLLLLGKCSLKSVIHMHKRSSLAKLVDLGLQIQTSLKKIQNGRHKHRCGQHTLAAKNIKKSFKVT